MTKEFYDKLAEPFEGNEKKRMGLIKINTMLTRLVYIVYLVLLVSLLIRQDARLLRVLLIPAASFVAVTVFRKLCNAKRPYEVWDTPPLIPKETKGNSFPSRHVFSIYIIAMAAGYVCLPLGICLGVAGVFLAAVRVISRIHFVKDVVAGACIGILLGWVGFILI